MSGVGGVGGAGRVEGPDDDGLELADPARVVADEGQVVRGQGGGPRGDFQGDLLRMRFEESTVSAPAMVEKPVTDGLKGDWNKGLTSGLKSLGNLKLADQGEKAIRDLVSSKLKESAPGAPPEQIDAMAAELAKGLRSAKLAGKNMDDVAKNVEGYVQDAGDFLVKKLTFTKMEAEVREQVKAAGGLNPGEDKVIHDQKVAPAAAEVQKAAEKLKFKADFGGDVKVDFKKLFGHADQAIKQVDGTAKIKWEKTDFKTEVGAKLEILDPLTKGASVRMMGYAELHAGKFDARIEGKAEVKDLYTDPKFGPTADLSASMRYADPSLGVTATLSGNVKIPLYPGQNTTWDAKAGFEKRSLDGTFSGRVEAGVAGTNDRWDTTYASIGMEKKFNDRVSGTLTGRIDSTHGGPTTGSAMVGLKVNF